MGKYMALLDAGMRVIARFQSHCPQTARMYYKPPTTSGNSNRNDKNCNGGNGTGRGGTLRTALILLKKVDFDTQSTMSELGETESNELMEGNLWSWQCWPFSCSS